MGQLGRLNPLPLHVGGNPSPAEKVYRAMRAAVGMVSATEQAAGPEGGIEDSWRLAKARVIARTAQLDELAALQALPDRATVHLEVYEALLQVPQAETTVERQAAITAVWTANLSALIPRIRAHLEEIGLDVLNISHDQASVAHYGQHYADRTDPGAYGQRSAAMMPNYSTHWVLHVVWTGCPSGIPPADKRATVERYLNEVLPCWCDFVVLNGSGPFYFDGYLDSRLDLTPFGG